MANAQSDIVFDSTEQFKSFESVKLKVKLNKAVAENGITQARTVPGHALFRFRGTLQITLVWRANDRRMARFPSDYSALSSPALS